MGRWAYGDELACGGKPAGSGGCRNLAEWLIRPKQGRPWLRCTLHLDSSLRMLRTRWETSNGLYPPEVEPFQDATEVPVRKRKRPSPRAAPGRG